MIDIIICGTFIVMSSLQEICDLFKYYKRKSYKINNLVKL